MIRSPAGEPPRPGWPWPLSRTREPRLGAGRHGDGDRALRPDLARAMAGGAGLRRDLSPAAALGTRTVDGEAALAERDVPRPLHSSQVSSLAPGAPHRCRGTWDRHRSPAWSRRSCHPGPPCETAPRASTRSSRPAAPPGGRGRRWTRRCRPGRPSPPMSPKSTSSSTDGPPAGAARPRRPDGAARVSNAPSRRIWSYCFRFSGSESVPCASEICLKRSADCGLLGLASG